MSFTLDFTNVEDKSFAPLPPATYAASVFEVKVKPTSAGDSMNLNWQFKIEGGEYDNRRVFATTNTKPTALWKVKQYLKNIAPEIDLSGMADLDLEMLVGRKCRVVLGMRTWEGQEQNDVKNVLPPSNAVAGDEDMPF